MCGGRSWRANWFHPTHKHVSEFHPSSICFLYLLNKCSIFWICPCICCKDILQLQFCRLQNWLKWDLNNNTNIQTNQAVSESCRRDCLRFEPVKKFPNANIHVDSVLLLLLAFFQPSCAFSAKHSVNINQTNKQIQIKFKPLLFLHEKGVAVFYNDHIARRFLQISEHPFHLIFQLVSQVNKSSNSRYSLVCLRGHLRRAHQSTPRHSKHFARTKSPPGFF